MGGAVLFLGHQAINLLTAAFFIVALISIRVGPKAHPATLGGLVAAGVAFAAKRSVSATASSSAACAARSSRSTFSKPPCWRWGSRPQWKAKPIRRCGCSRQYTGRIVVVTNGVIFDEPVYNHSRDFPFLWEEIHVSVGYTDKYGDAERILLDVARTHTLPIARMTGDARRHLERVYDLQPPARARPRDSRNQRRDVPRYSPALP